MKRLILFLGILFLTIPFSSYCQDIADSAKTDYKTEIANFRKGRNIKMMYSEGSPLKAEQRKDFQGLSFFIADEKYKIEATIQKTPEQKSVFFKTSTEREPEYIVYGKITFVLEGQQYKLSVYQSKKLSDTKQDLNEVFIPFRDETTGKGSYKGGRYVDCELPVEGNTIIVDFNKAYNPYCAYNPKYSCVIPPEENRLSIRIEAGEKKFDGSH